MPVRLPRYTPRPPRPQPDRTAYPARPPAKPRRTPNPKAQRRNLTGLAITAAVWFLSSLAVALVVEINANSWLIYPFGFLSVVTIPTMLVFIFLLMRRLLDAE